MNKRKSLEAVLSVIFAVLFIINLNANAAGLGELGVLDTSGTNPATGNEWAVGDQYRLVFATSEGTRGIEADIAYYNGFVQGVADAAGLGTVTWNCIGSTADVDARDNTGTNPAVEAGVPIFLVDGTSLVASDNADLWNGDVLNSLLTMDENGDPSQSIIWTGTKGDGAKVDGKYLGIAGQVTIGTPYNTTTTRWIANGTRGAHLTTTVFPVYSLSEVLTVSSGNLDIPSVNVGNDWITWSTKLVVLNPVVVNNDTQVPQRPLSYAWTFDAPAGCTVVFSPSDDVEAQTVTVTKAANTGDASVVTLTLSVMLQGEAPVSDSLMIDVYDNSCEAAAGIGTPGAFGSADFNMDCITDMLDLAEMAAEWLVDYSLSEAVDK